MTNWLRTGVLYAMVLALWLIMFTNCHPPLPKEITNAYVQLPDRIDFNFHIKPILSDRCYKCHGPDDDERKSNFRLDRKEGAFAKLQESNGYAFVKGRLNKSMAWNRLISENPEFMMPPPESHLHLTPNEKALIAKWIEQGAEWKDHWALVPPSYEEIPFIENDQAQNEIDHFILRKLKENGLKLSEPASKERLIRRLTFDLTGLPPSLEEIDEFLADKSLDAFDKIVERLLQSDAHAERMAMEWLDVARYADSHGMHADGLREMWPWRDWVISAFKKNMPYDQFATWQLAGDLLPHASREQKLATAFHRNQPLNSELGIVSEEYRLKYAADRTNTTATAFMGLTMECATCHDHKYDPITQKEYYEMTAFFNNVNELGMIGNDRNFGPLLMLPDAEQEKKLKAYSNKINELQNSIKITSTETELVHNFIDHLKSNSVQVPKPDGFFPLDKIRTKVENDKSKQILDNNEKSEVTSNAELVTGKIGKAIRIDDEYELVYLGGTNNFELTEPYSCGVLIKTEKSDAFQSILGNIGDKNTGWRGWLLYLDTLNRPGIKMIHSLSHNFVHLTSTLSVQKDRWTSVYFTYDGSTKAAGIKLFVNGREVETKVHHDNLYKSILPIKSRKLLPDHDKPLKMGKSENYLFSDTDNAVYKGSFDHVQIYQSELTGLEVATIFKNMAWGNAIQPISDDVYLSHYLQRHDEKYQDKKGEIANLRNEKHTLTEDIKEVMVVQEMKKPRETYVLKRGEYTTPGERVFPNTPSSIFSFPEHLPKNRLGIAKWLFHKDHPLTARVAVNRYWQMIFGAGIVDTPHDFGTQGSLPSHPELLDWLAVKFRESHWDVRALIKLMVSSASYRQSSKASEELLSKDPKNILLSRGPNYRLPAEMIRDNALKASGLLVSEIGGESVKPYQPEGLWKDKNEFSGFLLTYKPHSGDSLYRRSMYTFIRRTSPPPSMLAFDLPDRSICNVKREKTSTPQQALVLMNDPQYIEAARVLAESIQHKEVNNIDGQLDLVFRLICGRRAKNNEIKLMVKQFEQAMQDFTSDPKSANDLLAIGEFPNDKTLDPTKTAALSTVANMIFNFDEAYMKR